MATATNLCSALNPEACPASDFTTLHVCSRPQRHNDGIRHPMHECLCGVRWLSQYPAADIPSRRVVAVAAMRDVIKANPGQRHEDTLPDMIAAAIEAMMPSTTAPRTVTVHISTPGTDFGDSLVALLRRRLADGDEQL